MDTEVEAAENLEGKHEANERMTNPNEPTLTCSEVVERLVDCQLIKECIDRAPLDPESQTELLSDICDALSKHAPAILHSWRERRVQELEECLRQASGKLLIMADSPFWVKTLQREEISKELHLLSDEIKNTLANSEWREQIRKGAKHD